MYQDKDILVEIFFALRMFTLAFLTSVLLTQLRLFKRRVPKDVNTTRKIMAGIIFVLIIAQVIPSTIDLVVLATENTAADWLVIYRAVNIISTSVASVGFWLLYQDIGSKNKRN